MTRKTGRKGPPIWQAERIARREFRQSREAPEIPPHIRKKTSSEKAICKKSPTREHNFQPYKPNQPYAWLGFRYKCIHCGKRHNTPWTPPTE